MKRRILGVILTVSMLISLVLSLASCGAYSAFDKALEETFSTGHGSDLTVVITGTVHDDGVEQLVNLKYDIKIDKSDITKTCVVLTVDDDPNSKVTYYTDGDYVYVDFNGSQLKVSEFDFKKENVLMAETIRSGLLYRWDKLQVEGADCQKKDGVITFNRMWVDSTSTLAGNHVLAAQPRNILVAAFYEYEDDFDSSTTTDFTNASLTATAKDGFITGMIASAVITSTDPDLRGDLKMEMTVNNPGQDVSVTLPSGCTTWEEFDID